MTKDKCNGWCVYAQAIDDRGKEMECRLMDANIEYIDVCPLDDYMLLGELMADYHKVLKLLYEENRKAREELEKKAYEQRDKIGEDFLKYILNMRKW